ncbi:hypothetical protein SDC9_75522 [bioreactor metagenome]|uniref:Uncharacterized protein n=1 Tax=bioreactor metagenome TaxID=1076179 RepID=A0A644YSE4_9ZZZZ
MIDVPRLFISLAVPPKLRILIVFAVDKLGLAVTPPGNNCMMSESELVCKWSIACLDIFEAVA